MSSPQQSAVLTLLLPAGIIVPPLPEKNVVQKYQMTSEFIEQRRRALQVYINRVVSQTCGTGIADIPASSLLMS